MGQAVFKRIQFLCCYFWCEASHAGAGQDEKQARSSYYKGERGRQKEEGEGRGELWGVKWLRWRKDRYGSREEDILIKGGIVELARVLTLERVPDVHRDVPS